ncbi:serine/threonine protein phosphatase 1 [Afipia massiliensis]|uniref:Serine/threonine protein phosphatase 1 n=1 Tax=Afipia massiliensis TaxID=211460 RepID=A0A840N7Z3_9BRAD|nr:metallophosphoesterase [Afipia massiliensis]MBB5053861.1 serine/threonine protein phosphatase 1 [Afipia massiliensis]
MRSGTTHHDSRAINAAVPPNTRVYAVGDVHGRSDLLAETIARIDEDVRRRPVEHVIEVYLGDYIDRGPDSSGVLDLLAVRLVRRHAICLRGNHEAILERFLRQDADALYHWSKLGGLQTLASYGIVPRSRSEMETPSAIRRSLIELFPREHELFLQCLRNSFVCGDFLFVHAGIKPGVPMNLQDPEDLHWIRDEFLNSEINHGKVIVHGHTPVDHPDIRQNRINIDTGAWRTGVLTCIAIEDASVLVL